MCQYEAVGELKKKKTKQTKAWTADLNSSFVYILDKPGDLE